MRRSLLSRAGASNTVRAVAAVALAVGGSLAVKYAPAQLASLTGAQLTSGAPGIAPASPGDSGFVHIARQVTPAVVYIEVQSAPRAASRNRGLPPGFELPPGFQLGPSQPQRRSPVQSSGSGFIVSANGEILTNNHVVEDAERITVTLYDRRIFPAKVIGRDPATDVALIKIEATGLPTLPLGDDAQVQVGQPVVAIGAPLGLRSTVTTGIISAKERGGDLRGLFSTDLAVVDFLQTDAVINPGNSGGPLIDMSGRVIGINSAIESPTGVYAGYGFAVPVSIARIAMDQFKQYGRVRRAILGVSIDDVTATDAQAAGLTEIRGALVNGFSGTGSAAERAGLKPGDIILSIDGRPIPSVSVLQRTVYGYRPGQTVTLAYQRFGTQGSAKVTLMEAEQDRQVASADRATEPGAAPASRLGIQVQPLTPQLVSQLRLNDNVRGVVVGDVDPAGPAARELQRGDVIVAVLGRGGVQTPVTSAEQLTRAIANAPNGVASLLVNYGGNTRVVNIALPR